MDVLDNDDSESYILKFDDRFVIKSKLTQGSFGKIYAGEDTKDGESKDIVLKINE